MQRWFKLVLDHPWVVMGVVVVLTAFAASFLPRITFDASIDAMIPRTIQFTGTDGSCGRLWYAGPFSSRCRAITCSTRGLEEDHDLAAELRPCPVWRKCRALLTPRK